MVKNRHGYVVITSLFINICSSLNQIGSRSAMMRTGGGGWLTVFREFWSKMTNLNKQPREFLYLTIKSVQENTNWQKVKKFIYVQSHICFFILYVTYMFLFYILCFILSYFIFFIYLYLYILYFLYFYFILFYMFYFILYVTYMFFIFFITWDISFCYINHEWVNIKVSQNCFVIIFCKLYCKQVWEFFKSSHHRTI
jgi:hypothetical protein